jgi:ATP-dependent DNA ligase
MVGQMMFGRRMAEAVSRSADKTAANDTGRPICFVAVDLLAIDDDTLLDVPLLERKRILDSAFEERALVRRTPFVRPPVDQWMVAWRGMGFREVAYKAANSRYTPGDPNDDWAAVAIPRD